MHHAEKKCAHFCFELWDMEQVHYGICEIGLFHWKNFINSHITQHRHKKDIIDWMGLVSVLLRKICYIRNYPVDLSVDMTEIS